MQYPNARIIVFAKAPVAGQCKTRLIPALGEQGAAELHAQLLHHTLRTSTDARLCPVELWCADNSDHPFIKACSEQYDVVVRQQQGNNLGERMHHAFQQILTDNTFAILIGSDCPTLGKQDLDDALLALHSGIDCTLNPAMDGGYVAIGLSRLDSTLFDNIHWGTASVYEETLQRLKTLDWWWKKLATHHDIDRPEDLEHLKLHPSPSSQKWITTKAPRVSSPPRPAPFLSPDCP